jgi:hypothetical protein
MAQSSPEVEDSDRRSFPRAELIYNIEKENAIRLKFICGETHGIYANVRAPFDYSPKPWLVACSGGHSYRHVPTTGTDLPVAYGLVELGASIPIRSQRRLPRRLDLALDIIY